MSCIAPARVFWLIGGATTLELEAAIVALGRAIDKALGSHG